jgi:hypothetical protein
MYDLDEDTSYQSQSGFRIWGGTERPVKEPSMRLKWLSLAFVVGIAVALGTWFVAAR